MSENQLNQNTTRNSPTSPPINSILFTYPKLSKKYVFTDNDESKTVREAKCLDNEETVAIKRISFKKENQTIEDLMVNFYF